MHDSKSKSKKIPNSYVHHVVGFCLKQDPHRIVITLLAERELFYCPTTINFLPGSISNLMQQSCSMGMWDYRNTIFR